MSGSEPTLSEGEIRSLVAEDSTPGLSPEQRSRLMQRLGLVEDDAVVSDESHGGGLRDAGDDSVSDISTTAGPSKVAPRSDRRWSVWVAAAAAVILAGLAIVAIGNRADEGAELEVAGATESEPIVVATPPYAEPAAVALCRDRIGPFVAAIAVWDGVDNWAALADSRLPEPDLLSLSLDAVVSAEDVLASEGTSVPPALQEARSALEALRAEVPAALGAQDAFEWSIADRQAHQSAVSQAEAAIAALVEQESWAVYDGCG